MQILRFKDRFILNQNHNQINFSWRAILFILLAFLPFDLKASQSINLAIIDTGFCYQKFTQHNILLMPAFDATSSIANLKCDDSTKNLPRFHGQKVLDTFLKYYHSKKLVKIFPIIVYDSRAETNEVYWKKTLDYIKSKSFDYAISAVGIKSSNLKLSETIRPIWFLAAARISPTIQKDDSIFPQNQFKKKNVYLFGSFDQMGYVDRGQLNLAEIDLFTKDEDQSFYGSSFAVGKIAALLLNDFSKKNLVIKKVPGTFLLNDSR